MSGRRRARLGALLATVVAVAALGTLGAAVAPARPAAATEATPSSVIKHVIVVMQSSHSFDNYFGTRAGVDGIPANVCLKLRASSAACVPPYHLLPGQSRAGLSDTLTTTERAINGGKMDGFAIAQPNASIGTTAMGHLNRSDLPYYWDLADRFTLYDHFYATSRAGPLPNRVVAMTGQDAGLTTNTVPAGGLTTPTVFDQLNQANLSWKYYFQGYASGRPVTPHLASLVPLLAEPSAAAGGPDASHLASTDTYFTDLTTGRLPAVSYVTGTVNSERAPRNVTQGQDFVKTVVDALMQSPEWGSTALLLVYDDGGGWYDHAAPPTMGGVAQGIRVPAILVSPYAKAGTVEHADLNTASVPGLVDSVFGLPPLTPQVSAAGDLLSGVDVHQQPIAPSITPLAAGATVAARPTVGPIYLLYGLVVLLVLGLVGLAVRRTRRPSPATGGTDALRADGASEPPPGQEDPPVPAERPVGPAPLFALYERANPHPLGTELHDAWESGHAEVAMSSAGETRQAKRSMELAFQAGDLIEAGDETAAARLLGEAAAHYEMSVNLAEAAKVAPRSVAHDDGFDPTGADGRPLTGYEYTEYAQGYVLGRSEIAGSADPHAYARDAEAALLDTPARRKSGRRVAKGRVDGARRWLLDADASTVTAGSGTGSASDR